MLKIIFDDADFILLLSLTVYLGASALYKRTKSVLFHPLLVTGFFLILLIEFDIVKFDTYVKSSELQGHMLPLLIMAFALPLYRWRKAIFRHAVAMFSGAFVGLFVSFFSVWFLIDWLNMPELVGKSLLTKSVTTPVAIELAVLLKGSKELAAVAVLVTGLVGYVSSPLVFKLLHITDPIARGFALGTASHIVGAARAEDYGDMDVAAAGAAIGIFSIMTAFFVLAWIAIV